MGRLAAGEPGHVQAGILCSDVNRGSLGTSASRIGIPARRREARAEGDVRRRPPLPKRLGFQAHWTEGPLMLKPNDIRKARRHLRSVDPVMRAVIDAVGPVTLRLERDRFGMLVRSIISQQISTSAARSIRGRLQELAGPGGLKAANIARFTGDQLRSVGLSPQKASYIADLARKVNQGTVELRQIGRLADERIVEQLTQVRGIGRWTAQMFLIFSLGRLDVFPHDDLGVRAAIRDRYGLDDMPDKQTALAIAAPWRPYASVASWYCWRSLDLKRKRETVAKGYPT